MNPGETIALGLLEFAVRLAPRIVELVTGQTKETLEERIARARSSITDPIDTAEDDAARWARLEQALTGGR